jgi:hypothetical protein
MRDERDQGLARTVVIHGENMNTAAKLSSYALVAATTLLLVEAASGQMSGPAGKPSPKLVLFMVIDGFPQDQFVKYYDSRPPGRSRGGRDRADIRCDVNIDNGRRRK